MRLTSPVLMVFSWFDNLHNVLQESVRDAKICSVICKERNHSRLLFTAILCTIRQMNKQQKLYEVIANSCKCLFFRRSRAKMAELLAFPKTAELWLWWQLSQSQASRSNLWKTSKRKFPRLPNLPSLIHIQLSRQLHQRVPFRISKDLPVNLRNHLACYSFNRFHSMGKDSFSEGERDIPIFLFDMAQEYP